jgi:hypothetical protein
LTISRKPCVNVDTGVLNTDGGGARGTSCGEQDRVVQLGLLGAVELKRDDKLPVGILLNLRRHCFLDKVDLQKNQRDMMIRNKKKICETGNKNEHT